MQQDNEDLTKQLRALPSPHAVLVYYHKCYFCISSYNTDFPLVVSLHKLKPQSEQPMPQRIIQAKCLLKISLRDAYFKTDHFFFNILIHFSLSYMHMQLKAVYSQYLIFLWRGDALQCAQKAGYYKLHVWSCIRH